MPHREKPWGTAHAVLVAAEKINEPFAVINADDYYGVSAFKTIADFLTTEAAPDHYAMVGYVLKNTLSDHGTVNRGVCVADENNHLVDVVERHKIGRADNQKVYFTDDDGSSVEVSEDAIVSMNFWGFHQNIFDVMRKQFVEFAEANKANPKAEFYIPLVANTQINNGAAKLSVLTSNDNWHGVTYKADKPIVQKAFNKLFEDGVYPSSLW